MKLNHTEPCQLTLESSQPKGGSASDSPAGGPVEREKEQKVRGLDLESMIPEVSLWKKKTHIEETSPFFQVVCILVMCLNGRGDFFRAQHRLGNFLADYLPRERPL